MSATVLPAEGQGAHVALLETRIWIVAESSTNGHVYWCPACGHALLANADGIFEHDGHIPHPLGMLFDEEETPQ